MEPKFLRLGTAWEAFQTNNLPLSDILTDENPSKHSVCCSYRQCEAWWQLVWWDWGGLCLPFQCTAAWRRRARPPLCLGREAGTFLQPRRKQTNIKHFASLEILHRIWFSFLSEQRQQVLQQESKMQPAAAYRVEPFPWERLSISSWRMSYTHPRPCWWTQWGCWAPDLRPR